MVIKRKPVRKRRRRHEEDAVRGYTTGREAHGRSKQEGVISLFEDKAVPTRRVPGAGGQIGDGNPKNTRMLLLLDGQLDVTELSDAELAAGVPLCDDGKFSVRAAQQSSIVPKSIQNRMRRELVRRVQRKLDAGAMSAVQALVSIASSKKAMPADRIKAATVLLERLLGRAPQEIKHTTELPWEVIVEGLLGGSRTASRARRAAPDAYDQGDEVLEGALASDAGEELDE